MKARGAKAPLLTGRGFYLFTLYAEGVAAVTAYDTDNYGCGRFDAVRAPLIPRAVVEHLYRACLYLRRQNGLRPGVREGAYSPAAYRAEGPITLSEIGDGHSYVQGD